MHTLTVPLPGSPPRAYDVILGPGARHTLPERLAALAPGARFLVVADATVAPLHADPLAAALAAAGLAVDVLTFPAGEANKTVTTWAALADAALALGVGRDACVVAVGGGVTGDVAGFLAATLHRGLPLVQVPTTLLAMVDAAIGGKTGVDAAAGKNLIGAFHHPALVVADPEVLATLPDEELRAGLAEAAKHGAIADAAHLRWLAGSSAGIMARDADTLLALIRRSVEIKVSFVAADPGEAGARAALNFGHTIGHALEAASGYSLRHGFAVAMGMVAEAEIGEALGVTAAGEARALAAALGRLGLPTAPPPGTDAEEILRRTRADKKARARAPRYALLARLGRTHGSGGDWTTAVPDEVVRTILLRSLSRAPDDATNT
jgi:3-dehydroquinate synthase